MFVDVEDWVVLLLAWVLFSVLGGASVVLAMHIREAIKEWFIGREWRKARS